MPTLVLKMAQLTLICFISQSHLHYNSTCSLARVRGEEVFSYYRKFFSPTLSLYGIELTLCSDIGFTVDAAATDRAAQKNGSVTNNCLAADKPIPVTFRINIINAEGQTHLLEDTPSALIRELLYLKVRE